ncbi:MAG TPA: sulfite exporter TauE/SafE family protein [Candidatus Avacidaminococcus intestinavium]|uniref:Probable membrane transporter protein n=1 Tax=Candidatus Avacidaminococcus intestinavium TaxID=2840684 RepID=A0A9D1MR55_9FIRM|nr:sulfite exporter TauE/SafE family protein [Candidatus Avacidaminococcus intestinavium]
MYAFKKIFAGFIIGLLSGFLGIGGGVFMVPIMVSFFGFTQHVAQATSLAMIIPTALFGSIVYNLHGSIDIKIAALITVGSMTSAFFASRLMVKLPAAQLKLLFGILLLLVGVRMVIA